MAEPVKHQLLEPQDKLKASGKRTDLVHAPIVSVNPASEDSVKGWGEKEDFLIVDKANKAPTDGTEKKEHNSRYPFLDLEIDQGVFIPAKPGLSTDQLVEQLHKDIYLTREQVSEVERNEDGDEILDMICVKTRKRNEDGTIQLDPYGKPIVGANFEQRPKLISARHFIVRAVTKDYDIAEGQKAPHDGVLVIRTV